MCFRILTIAVLIGLASPPLAMAQAPGVCAACVAGAACDSTAAACIAECQARFFTIDPNRATCGGRCAAAQTQCERSATAECRQNGACR